MKKNSCLAIIPARGGSKRIPRKNIINFMGKPIIEYSIKAALESSLFEEVIVSTDDHKISEFAMSLGATVPFIRSKKSSSDTAIISDVLKEVIEKYEQLGKKFDYLCCIYPTAPFIDSSKLINSYLDIQKSGVDTVLAVVKNSFPIQRSLIYSSKYLEFERPEYMNTRSQDLPVTYRDAGQFFWIRTKSFKDNHIIINEKTVGYIVDESDAQDIDTFEDLKIAEMKHSWKRNKRMQSSSF